MKKISLSILITLILINVITPFGIIINGTKIEMQKNIVEAADCSVVSANWIPSGTQQSGNKQTNTPAFYRKGITQAKIAVKTKNCENYHLYFTVTEKDAILTDVPLTNSGLEDLNITVPSDNFTVDIMLGMEGSDGLLTFTSQLYFEIKNGPDYNRVTYYNSNGKVGGLLSYSTGYMSYAEGDTYSHENGRYIRTTKVANNVNPPITTREYWWFANEKGKITGDALFFDQAFTSSEKCKAGRISYINGLSTIPDRANVGDCEQRNSDKTILGTKVDITKLTVPENNTPANNDSGTPVSLTPGKEGPTADTVYKPLVPLPGLEEPITSKNIGDYFNIMITIIIGLCAVLAVVMLVIGGVQYMGSESIFGKTDAKGQMTKAILGLLIAIGSYALLNTINPDLLGKRGVAVKMVSAEIIENFQVSGSATLDGSVINIDFNTEAYPAAKKASRATGVDTAFILAMFDQETSSGRNTGKCNYLTANMNIEEGQLESLKKVIEKLGGDYKTINMSCSGGGSTHGGAIGFTQFLPGTWLEYSPEAKDILGYEPNPWNVDDALMMTALFLKHKGGGENTTDAKKIAAACSYFGSCFKNGKPLIVSCGGKVTGTYGQCIMAKKASIQKQIDAL